MSPFFIIFVDMGKYVIIGTDGVGVFMSLDGMDTIMLDSRNPNQKLFIYYKSGKVATISLRTAVPAADTPKWFNFFVDTFTSIANGSASNWETSTEQTTIGGPKNPTTGVYPSLLPFNDSLGNPIEISSITVI